MCIRDRQEAARGAEEGQGVDVEGAADGVVGQLQQRLAGDDAGVVDEDVHVPVSYTHLPAHATGLDIVCRLSLDKKKTTNIERGITSDRKRNQQNTAEST